jgi:hypothetical protein
MATQPTNLPVPSESPRDLKFNAGKIDEFVTSKNNEYVDRFGEEHRTIAGITYDANQAMLKYGYITKKSFEIGATLDTPNTILQWESNGEFYRWDGDWSQPKVVPAGSTPESTGGIGEGKWIGVGDASLRSDLAESDGVALVNGAAKIAGDNFTGPVTAPTIKSLSVYGQMVAGNKTFGNSGDDWPNSSALRDAVTVSRGITNNLTDCHAFSDKTVITNASDYGGYGAFDATTWLKGSTVQNHIFSFQDRIIHQGTANLENQVGFYSRPEIRSSGNVLSRMGVKVYDVQKSSTGIAVENIGIYVENLSGTNTSAITLLQSNGYTIYAPNAGMTQLGGVCGFGTSPVGGTNPIYIKNTGGSKIATVKTTNTDVAFGSQTDDVAGIAVGNAIRVQVKQAGNLYAFTPATNGTAPLGDASNRWSAVYAASGTINTSDERFKTELIHLEDAERNAALEIKANIRRFKMNDAVESKGFSNARWHFGVGAQTVGDIMRKHGLDPKNYAFWCFDSWADEYVDEVEERVSTNDEGIEKRESLPTGRKILIKKAGEAYGIRYDELSMFILASI